MGTYYFGWHHLPTYLVNVMLTQSKTSIFTSALLLPWKAHVSPHV